MIDYISCLGSCFPTVFATCGGDPNIYENIVWVDGDPLPDVATLDAARFKKLQASVLEGISDSCENTIMAGFTSNALGSTYFYQSTTLDQINLIGALISSMPNALATSGTPIPYKCGQVIDGVVQTLSYNVHNPTQMLMVFMSGVQFKLEQLTIYQNKENYISTCTTPEEVNAVTWTSTP